MTLMFLINHLYASFVTILILMKSIFSSFILSFQYVGYLLALTYPTYFQNSGTYAHANMLEFYDNMMNILFYTLGVIMVILFLTILKFNNNPGAFNSFRNLIKSTANFVADILFSSFRVTNANVPANLLKSLNVLTDPIKNYFNIGFIRRRYYKHESLTEAVWTIIPFCIIGIIATPSFHLLYLLAEISEPVLTLKIIGHQWYWSYEYGDFIDDNCSIAFDSYMIPSDDLQKGQLRLLDVDNHVLLPINTTIRLVITSADVIHCWTIPNFGVKVDACPGRLSQTTLYLPYKGCYYGQCSEICGIQHGFMPIVVEAVSHKVFKKMINTSIN